MNKKNNNHLFKTMNKVMDIPQKINNQNNLQKNKRNNRMIKRKKNIINNR